MNSKRTIVSNIEASETTDGVWLFTNAALGAKGFNLAKVSASGLPVPQFLVLTPAAFFSCLSDEERASWPNSSTKERTIIVQKIAVSQSLSIEIANALNSNAMNGQQFAVRSSSVDEDGTGLSYAGQFTSILEVGENEISSAVEAVWQSAFTSQVISYRSLNGLHTPPDPPCVIIQTMVPALVAGVAFGANPVNGDREVVTISSVHGLADKLVSGEVDSATYHVRGDSVEVRMNEEVGPLTDEQLFSIKSMVEKSNEIFGCPQDIEWAIDKYNQLFILQSRPITTLASPDVSTGNERLDIFDNSNIGESYPGMTTPLTFSFARKAYQHVYETFCRLMGVSESAIEKNSYIFPQMLGFVRGRIYYNLLNWYRLLSLFPGFKTNRGFMEQMMGVKAGLPQEFLAEFDKELTIGERLQDAIAMSITIPKLLFQWWHLPQDIRSFNTRVERSLSRVPKDLKGTSTDDLGKLYRSMEQDLLLEWDAPIVNDFFAMISFGFLRGICGKWFGNLDGIHNQLLCGETGIVSTEPVARLKQLASIAAQDAVLLDTVKQGAVEKLNQFPTFFAAYEAYLDKFGDRCTGELKLESPTVVDNPGALLTAIARLAAEPEVAVNRAQGNRIEAERQAMSGLGNNLIKIVAFNLVLAQTRTRIRERENLRFMRTRVFGAVRKIFVELGRRLESKGILESREDIFFLETEEVLRFIEGTSTTGNLQDIVNSRKEEFETFRAQPAPKDRFMVRGGLNLNRLQIEEEGAVSAPLGTNELRGLGCCPGIIKGFARVIDDPNTQQLLEGEILVAKRTDPGWITVIAQARGIVVEYGSLLSHTAIVARELGIPTIVSVSNVTTSVNTGDWLEINGATGEVRVTPRIVDVALALEATTDGIDAKKQEPALMKSEIQGKAGFEFVRYAQCWEDTDIVLEAMNIKPGDTCLSIASAGDNSLAMLAHSPAKVVALDLNPSQLALLELKAAAFKHLSHQNMLVLLGYRQGKNRLSLFDEILPHLSHSSQLYWCDHVSDIEFGVAARGKFERYFDIFRVFSLPLTHSQRTVDELLKPKAPAEREQFYKHKWNTFRWRALFKVFFSEIVMGALGRDPSFFQYAEGGLPAQLMTWTRKALVDQDPSKNPYLHWILKGEFGSVLPNFLREENFEAIKANVDKLEWHQKSIEEYLSDAPDVKFDSFNLSDVFEYMSEDNYKSIMKLIADASQSDARVIYWNMMAPRTSERAGLEDLRPMTEIANELFKRNNTFFYSKFIVEEVKVNQTPVQQPAFAVANEVAVGGEGRAA